MTRSTWPAWAAGAAVIALAAGAAGPARAADAQGAPLMLRSLDPPVLLPDGTEFQTWESARPPEFSRTWHVDAGHAAASDDGPGTADRPFQTIGRAAQVLQPGERVVVAAGVYRERVRPPRGGTGPDRLISYEAAPGAEVVLKGSKVFQETWTPAPGGGGEGKGAWSAPLAPSCFGDYNPFDIDNVTAEQFDHMSWAQPLRGKVPYTLPRGLVFQDGRRLTQVAAAEALAGTEGAYWVDRRARVLHVRPFGGGDPNARLWEITTERVAFGPDTIGLGFIRVKGFTVEQVGNAFPMEQEGAISTWRGHHWIIEGNTVRQVNGVGIDVGRQFGHWPQPPLVGHHIVRGNTVEEAGVCGIAGLGVHGDFHLLIEGNVVRRAAWHDVERLYETAGIKTHLNTRCLLRRNLVVDTLHGPGIWMDYTNANSRCTQNVIVGTRTQWHGGIFIEASSIPNLIDHNIIWDTTGNGIYEHDSSNQIFVHNLIGRSTGAAVLLRGKVTDRKPYGRPIVDGDHRVAGNVFVECAKGGVLDQGKSRKSTVEPNLAEGAAAALERDAWRLAWSAPGGAPPGPPAAGLTHDFLGRPRPPGPVAPGPFADLPPAPTTITVWPIPGP